MKTIAASVGGGRGCEATGVLPRGLSHILLRRSGLTSRTGRIQRQGLNWTQGDGALLKLHED